MGAHDLYRNIIDSLLLDLERVELKSLAKPGENVETESLGWPVSNSRVRATKFVSGNFVDARIIEYRAQRILQPLDILPLGPDKKIEVGGRTREPMQTESNSAENRIIDSMLLECPQHDQELLFVHPDIVTHMTGMISQPL